MLSRDSLGNLSAAHTASNFNLETESRREAFIWTKLLKIGMIL